MHFLSFRELTSNSKLYIITDILTHMLRITDIGNKNNILCFNINLIFNY